jgi:hypothetical protein
VYWFAELSCAGSCPVDSAGIEHCSQRQVIRKQSAKGIIGTGIDFRSGNDSYLNQGFIVAFNATSVSESREPQLIRVGMVTFAGKKW